jgi:hypothetical protein
MLLLELRAEGLMGLYGAQVAGSQKLRGLSLIQTGAPHVLISHRVENLKAPHRGRWVRILIKGKHIYLAIFRTTGTYIPYSPTFIALSSCAILEHWFFQALILNEIILFIVYIYF